LVKFSEFVGDRVFQLSMSVMVHNFQNSSLDAFRKEEIKRIVFVSPTSPQSM
jgi:hypothetical protein